MSIALPAGTVLNGRYRVVRVLGTGAFGRVYLAEDIEDRGSTGPSPLLAIKELLAMEFASSEEQRDAMSWFKREVSALLTLEHPGIPAIHGYWTAHRTNGPLYLAMDYIPGKTLAEIHAEYGGRVPWQQVAVWGTALCEVLGYLHGRVPPIVFRDLKPANVLIESRTHAPVLIDFGLARQIMPDGGTAVGTWGYVPYEQVLGKAEPRSDLYALGALLHALLTGRQPDVEYRRLLRTGLDLEGALRALFPPVESLVPGVPAALCRVIATATAFAVEDRFASAATMTTLLRNVVAMVDAAPSTPSGYHGGRSASGEPGNALGASAAGAMRHPADSLAEERPPVMEGEGVAAPGAPSRGSSGHLPQNPRHEAGQPSHVARELPTPGDPAGVAARLGGEHGAGGDEDIPPSALPLDLESLPSLERLPDAEEGADGAAASGASRGPGRPSTARSAGDLRVSGGTSARSRMRGDPARPKWWQRGDREGTQWEASSRLALLERVRVSARGDGDCVSIAEGIRRARPGGRVEVAPGRYPTGFLIDRQVEIVGVGPVEEVLVEAEDGGCVMMQATEATIRGLTLRCLRSDGEERFHAVTVPMGRLVLEECRVESNSLACVAVHGEETRPALVRCVLRGGSEPALVFYNHARGLVEECDITAGTVPVRIGAHAQPTFHRCRIHDGRFAGVAVGEQGGGRFEECDIVRNGHHGVVIRHGGTPVLRRCRIMRNGWCGISLADRSGAIVEGCDLRENRRGPWDVRDTTRLRLEKVDNLEF